MSNTIEALREELFKTLRRLNDKDAPMEIDRAKAVSDVAQTIINSAKVEVDFMRVSNSGGSGFFPAAENAAPAALGPGKNGKQLTATGVKTVEGNSTVHRLR